MRKTLFIVFIFAACFSSAQSDSIPNLIKEDTMNMAPFFRKDTSIVNFYSSKTAKQITKVGNIQTNRFQGLFTHSYSVKKGDSIKGQFYMDTNMTYLSFNNAFKGSQLALQPSSIMYNADKHVVNGEWFRVPQKTQEQIDNYKYRPGGALVWNSDTRSLYSSNGDVAHPAYWEYFDGKNLDTYIPTFDSLYNIPVMRIRHPKNVSGVILKNRSLERDFKIFPYSYGMATEYNGVWEQWVGEFSVHRGHNYGYMGDGGTQWGAVCWVGDDEDWGGIRITARNDKVEDSSLFWSEISSENFNATSHGNLRMRIVNKTDTISFLQGTRGSKNTFAYIQGDSSIGRFGTYSGKSLAFQTEKVDRLSITPTGNVGIGMSNPKALLDVNGDVFINGLTIGLGSGQLDNTVIGVAAFSGIGSIGINNVAVGNKSLNSNNTGNNNTAIGHNSLKANYIGSDNTSLGYNNLLRNTSGMSNTVIGCNALINNTSGSYNTVVGNLTGLGIVSGSNNTIIGSRILGLPVDLQNNIIIADGEGNRRINVDYNGLVGIGTTQPTSLMDLYYADGSAQLRLRNSFTPSASNDAKGQIGNISWDDNYMYLKTNAGWKKVPLSNL